MTAAYLACKVEEFNVSIEQFIANINGNKERATSVILNSELLLMQEIQFHLTVHLPYRPVEGLMVDIKTRFPTVNPEDFRSQIEKFLNDVQDTNACLVRNCPRYSDSRLTLLKMPFVLMHILDWYIMTMPLCIFSDHVSVNILVRFIM